jgi:hypothetical protein
LASSSLLIVILLGVRDIDIGADRLHVERGEIMAVLIERASFAVVVKSEEVASIIVLGTQLKLAIPVPQPTPWIQTVWTPGISGAMSFSETTIFAVNDSSSPSPCR